jgi:hypothetical protein
MFRPSIESASDLSNEQFFLYLGEVARPSAKRALQGAVAERAAGRGVSLNEVRLGRRVGICCLHDTDEKGWAVDFGKSGGLLVPTSRMVSCPNQRRVFGVADG